jgi:hypothetical protein
MSLNPKTQNIIDFSYIGDIDYTTKALRIRDKLFAKYNAVMRKTMMDYEPEFVETFKGSIQSATQEDFMKFLSKKNITNNETQEAQMFFMNAQTPNSCFLPAFEVKEKHKMHLELSKDADGLANAVHHIVTKQVSRKNNKSKVLKPRVYINSEAGPIIIDIDSVIKAKAGTDSRRLIKKALRHMAKESSAASVATLSGNKSDGYVIFSEFEDGSRHIVTFDVTFDDEGYINGVKNKEEHSNLFGDLNGEFFGIIQPKSY